LFRVVAQMRERLTTEGVVLPDIMSHATHEALLTKYPWHLPSVKRLGQNFNKLREMFLTKIKDIVPLGPSSSLHLLLFDYTLICVLHRTFECVVAQPGPFQGQHLWDTFIVDDDSLHEKTMTADELLNFAIRGINSLVPRLTPKESA
jgi:hypothetical protein